MEPSGRVAANVPRGQVKHTALYKKCQTWIEAEYEGLVMGAATDPDALRLALEGGSIEALEKLEDSDERWTSVSLHACDTRKKLGFLSVDEVIRKENKKGESEVDNTTLLTLLRLKPDGLAAARALPERVEARRGLEA